MPSGVLKKTSAVPRIIRIDKRADQGSIGRYSVDAEVDRAVDRAGDVAEVGAEDDLDHLGRDQEEGPGQQQRVERPVVEVADDQMLERQADRAHRDGRQQHRGNERHAVAREPPGEIGAERQHGAMAHVDDADQPVDDRQPERRERQHERNQDGVRDDADEGFHEHAASLSH